MTECQKELENVKGCIKGCERLCQWKMCQNDAHIIETEISFSTVEQ